MRLAKKRSRSGCTVWSFLPTMYQPGFDFQAVPPAFASNKSGLGTPWVAQTSFCSCSERSPQKYFAPSVHDFDMGEDVGRREVRLLRLRRFVGVRSQRANVNQPDNAIVGSSAGNDGAAVGVADEDNRVADPPDRCFHQGEVLGRGVEAVLRRDTVISLRLQGNDQLAEARAIGLESMAEDDTRFSLRGVHSRSLLEYNFREGLQLTLAPRLGHAIPGVLARSRSFCRFLSRCGPESQTVRRLSAFVPVCCSLRAQVLANHNQARLKFVSLGRICRRGAEAPSNKAQRNPGPARWPDKHGENFVYTS